MWPCEMYFQHFSESGTKPLRTLRKMVREVCEGREDPLVLIVVPIAALIAVWSDYILSQQCCFPF